MIELHGLVVPFNTPAKVGTKGDWLTTIAPGAFDSSVNAGRVKALMGHSPSRRIADQRNGTLGLAHDHRGLFFWMRVCDRGEAFAIQAAAEAGLLHGCSIGWGEPVRDAWSPDRSVREIRAASLIEISICICENRPAFKGTVAVVKTAIARAA